MTTLTAISILLALTCRNWAHADQKTALDQAQKDILNFHVVASDSDNHPLILRGARPGSSENASHLRLDKIKLQSDIRDLQEIGVKTIIDLQGGDVEINVQVPEAPVALSRDLSLVIDAVNRYLEPGERDSRIQDEGAAARLAKINFESHPLDSVEPISTAEASEIVAILNLMRDPKQQPVYVHCEHGHDRTGLIVALYRMCVENMAAQTAYDEMLALGHNPNDHITQSTDIFFWKSAASPQFCHSFK